MSFFDTVSHEWLMRFVEHRIGDRRINRLVRKWLKAGVMEEGKLVTAEVGTPQRAVASPLLANIYLHYVFDLWANRWRKHHARGQVIIVRYADDIVMGFEHEGEARRFLADMRHEWKSSRYRCIRIRHVCLSLAVMRPNGEHGGA
jgi:RNA-directed DNA polymerase